MISSLQEIGMALLFCILVGLPAGLSACSPLTTGDPPLADSTFARVLVDLHLTTAQGDRFSTLPPSVEDSVLRYHGIQKKDFDATLEYYSHHPGPFKSLYNGVIDTLNALQNRYRESPSSDAMPDSIRKRMRSTRPGTP